MSISILSAGLLIVGGLVNAVPPVAESLKKMFGGKPVIQIMLGVISTVIGFILIADFI